MKILIVIATHKLFSPPKFDQSYLIFKSGSFYEKIPGYLRDDQGENISEMQPLVCELASLYCAWKNYSFDALGLVHYRRYFCKSRRKAANILQKQDIESLLTQYEAIVPKRSIYLFSTPQDFYCRGIGHKKETTSLRKHYILMLGEAIKTTYPEYSASYKKVSRRHYAHMKNMFIMKKEIANLYCAFLFNVLFAINKREKLKDRALGTLGEFCLDVFLDKNQIHYKEMPVFCTDNNDSLINKVRRSVCHKKK